MIDFVLPVQALMRGRKSSADTIEVQGINDSHIAKAAEEMKGFSGG